MIVARRYRVIGRVQGVGFRMFAVEAANREGVTGFVRNLDNGDVEALAEGEADAITRFERALHHGPPLAQVDQVEATTVPASMRAARFEVQ